MRVSWLRLFICLGLAVGVAQGVPADGDLRWGLTLFAFIGSLWLTQALHLSVTALLVPVLATVLGLSSPREALAAFAQPIVFLFLGGFALAAALRAQAIDAALAHAMIRLAGGRTHLAVLGLLGLTALLSMWLSNTATTALMVPLALGLLPRQGSDSRPLSADVARRNQVFILLGLAYSASIGGLGTLVGSPPNAIAAAQAGIGFAQWMAFGLPLVALLMPLMVGLLWWLHRPQLPQQTAADTPADWTWTQERRITVGIFVFTVLGWVGSAPLGRALGTGADTEALVALLAVVLLVGSGVLPWPALERDTQWGVLLLFGGGLALSQIMASSGSSRFLAESLLGWGQALHPAVLLLALVAFVVMLTELVSNTASAALLVPIVLGMAGTLGWDAAPLAMAVAASASCAFMLPVATPPNAIVFGTGHVPARDMARSGLALNLLAIGVITGITGFLA